MKKIKQNFWRLSLKITWLIIVFLISCKSNKDSKTNDDSTLSQNKDSIAKKTTEMQPLSNTLNKDTVKTVAIPVKKKQKPKPTVINEPKLTDPGPVCKYGVIRKEGIIASERNK